MQLKTQTPQGNEPARRVNGFNRFGRYRDGRAARGVSNLIVARIKNDSTAMGRGFWQRLVPSHFDSRSRVWPGMRTQKRQSPAARRLPRSEFPVISNPALWPAWPPGHALGGV